MKIKHKATLIITAMIFALSASFTALFFSGKAALQAGSLAYFNSDDNITIADDYVGDGGKGIRITIDTEGKNTASFNYRNYIKTSELNNFLEIGFEPQTIKESDFNYAMFTLSDSLDESKKLVYTVAPQPASSNWWNEYATSSISFTDNLTGTTKAAYGFATLFRIVGTMQNTIGINSMVSSANALYRGGYQDCGYGFGKNSEYFARTTADSKLKTVSFGFSNNIARIAGQAVANILDDRFLTLSSENLSGTPYENLYISDNAQNLFSSGYVTLSVKFMDIRTDSLSCYITRIGEQIIANNNDCTVKDAEPLIIADFNSHAVKNIPYKLPCFQARNIIDGDLLDSVVVTVKDSNNDEVLQAQNKVTFTQAGIYKIFYSATDARNNTFEKSYEIICYDKIPPTLFNYQPLQKTEYSTGETIAVSAATATNDLSMRADGSVPVTVLIQLNGVILNVYEALESTADYMLEKAGDYQLIYLYQNEGGSIHTACENFKVNEELTLIVNDLPPSFAVGKSVSIPDCKVINYINDTAWDRIFRAVYLGERRIFLAKGNNIIEGTLTVPIDAFTQKGNAKLVYKAGFTENNLVYSKEFDIPVIKPEYISDYIIPLDLNGVYNAEGVTQNNLREEVSFLTDRDKQFALPCMLPSQDLSFAFGSDSVNSDFEYISVILKNNLNGRKITFDVYKNNTESSLLKVNGNTIYTLDTSIINGSNYFEWTYLDDSRTLIDKNGKKVIEPILQYSDGSIFDGFKDASVNLSFKVSGVGVGKAKLRIINILNQSFGSTVIAGIPLRHNDLISPVIRYKNVLNGQFAEIATAVTIPSAQAFDVLDSNVSLSVSVFAPDGSAILDGVQCSKEYKLILQHYGIYKVVYTALDSNKLFETSETFIITVKDLSPPIITVQGNIKERLSVGETINIPKALVFDNTTQNCDCYVIVITPHGERKIISGSYKFESAGKYEIVYYAYDENYNVGQVAFSVTVK